MRVILFSLGVILFIASGCTLKQAVEDLRPSPFITQPERLRRPEDTPFDLAWVSRDVEKWRYDSLIVESVRTDCVNSDDWIYSASSFITNRATYLTRINDLAEYIQKRTIERFKKYSDRDVDLAVIRGEPVQELPSALPVPANDPAPADSALINEGGPTSRALRLELSICRADFGDPLLYSGLMAVPLPGVANLSTAVKSPSLTIEARLIDESTDVVVSELMDRRFPQVKIVDVNRMTVSSALREQADSFADDLVASFYRKSGEKVGRRWPFSLVPW